MCFVDTPNAELYSVTLIAQSTRKSRRYHFLPQLLIAVIHTQTLYFVRPWYNYCIYLHSFVHSLIPVLHFLLSPFSYYPSLPKVLKDGLRPVLCIGETQTQYEAGLNQEVRFLFFVFSFCDMQICTEAAYLILMKLFN